MKQYTKIFRYSLLSFSAVFALSGCGGGGDGETGSTSERNLLNEAPVAIITSITQNGTVTTLNGSGSYDTDGFITKYKWSTAQGVGIETDKPVVEIRNIPSGDYVVRLVVVDNEELTGEDAKEATITPVPPSNNPPIATPQDVTVQEDTPTNITLSGTDADGDRLTFSISTQPQHGTITQNGAGVTYTPDTGFLGDDSFGFTASDGIDESDPATISLKVVSSLTPPPENTPPVADAGKDMNVTGTTDSGATFDLNGSRSYDPDGNITSWTWSYETGDGDTVSIDGEVVTLSGVDEGTYNFDLVVVDDDGASSSADGITVTVTLVENEAPVIDGNLVDVSIPYREPQTVDADSSEISVSDDGYVEPLTYKWIDQTGNTSGVIPVINDDDQLHPTVTFSCSDNWDDLSNGSNCEQYEGGEWVCHFNFLLEVYDGEDKTSSENYFTVDYTACEGVENEESPT